MAVRTTDHEGRILEVQRSSKELPPIVDNNLKITNITSGQTQKMERVDTIASKLNQREKEDFGQIICGYNDPDDEGEEDGQTGNIVQAKALIVDNRDLQYFKVFKVDKPKASIVNFPVSNVHKALPSGTVIESPERIKFRED